MLRCWIFHVQRMIIDKQFHRIDRVPRVFGAATKFVLIWGEVQFGMKTVAWAIGFWKTPRTKKTRVGDGDMARSKSDERLEERSEPTQALSIRRHPDKYRLTSMRGSEEVSSWAHLSVPLRPCWELWRSGCQFSSQGSKLQRNCYEERLRLCWKDGGKRRKGWLSNSLGYERVGKETRVLFSVRLPAGFKEPCNNREDDGLKQSHFRAVRNSWPLKGASSVWY